MNELKFQIPGLSESIPQRINFIENTAENAFKTLPFIY